MKASGACRHSTEAEDTGWVGASPSNGERQDAEAGTHATDQEGPLSRAHLISRRSETWGGADAPGDVVIAAQASASLARQWELGRHASKLAEVCRPIETVAPTGASKRPASAEQRMSAMKRRILAKQDGCCRAASVGSNRGKGGSGSKAATNAAATGAAAALDKV